MHVARESGCNEQRGRVGSATYRKPSTRWKGSEVPRNARSKVKDSRASENTSGQEQWTVVSAEETEGWSVKNSGKDGIMEEEELCHTDFGDKAHIYALAVTANLHRKAYARVLPEGNEKFVVLIIEIAEKMCRVDKPPSPD